MLSIARSDRFGHAFGAPSDARDAVSDLEDFLQTFQELVYQYGGTAIAVAPGDELEPGTRAFPFTEAAADHLNDVATAVTKSLGSVTGLAAMKPNVWADNLNRLVSKIEALLELWNAAYATERGAAAPAPASQAKSKTWLYVAIGAGVVAVGGIAYAMTRKSKKRGRR